MALFTKTAGGITFNESCIEDKYIIEKFLIIAKNHGFDNRVITYGVSPSPDFGYFDLASRYWRTSLCIYMSGGVSCFLECGIGFTEPWLFNARHSFELTLKGLLLYSVWLEGVNNNLELSANISSIKNIRSHFPNMHSLSQIYTDYENKIKSVIENWNMEISESHPSLNQLLLNKNDKIILDELNRSDPTSFTFRYPSLKKESEHMIQRLDWKHDETQLFPKTGLPKESGYFFDHIKTVNSLHDFNMRLTDIKNSISGTGDYIEEMQSYMSDF